MHGPALCSANEVPMRSNHAYLPITAEQFVEIDFGDRRFELVDGNLRMMTGGSPAHSRVASNILVFLGTRLRGSGCRAYNSDMGLRVDEGNVRFPDVSVYCGDPASPERERQKLFTDPTVIFEVLSPSTAREDQSSKTDEYRTVASLDTIVFIDVDNETTRVIQRLGPTSWRDDMFAQPHDVTLPSLGVTVPHHEIFARD
jgi:Uma2 family endonuclease